MGFNPNELFNSAKDIINSITDVGPATSRSSLMTPGLECNLPSKYPLDILGENAEVSKAVQFIAKEYNWVRDSNTSENVEGGSLKGIPQWECYLPIPSLQETDSHGYDAFEAWGLGQAMGKLPGAVTTILNDPVSFNALDAASDVASPVAMRKAWEKAAEFAGKDLTAAARRSLWNGSNINPLASVIYSKSELREHSFQFVLAARNESESFEIRKIVRNFQYYSRPEAHSGALLGTEALAKAGLIVNSLRHPSIWEIKFVGNGTKDNSDIADYLPNIKSCVLKDFKIVYQSGSDSPKFFRSTGAPVFYGIEMSFKELYIQTKADVLNRNG